MLFACDFCDRNKHIERFKTCFICADLACCDNGECGLTACYRNHIICKECMPSKSKWIKVINDEYEQQMNVLDNEIQKEEKKKFF